MLLFKKNLRVKLVYDVKFMLSQHLILSHHLDAEQRDCIVIRFHIMFYASVAFRLHFSMSN